MKAKKPERTYELVPTGIETLPDFIKDKMKSSEEYKDRVLKGREAAQTTMPPKPRILGGPANIEGEYPTEDINPDDIPF